MKETTRKKKHTQTSKKRFRAVETACTQFFASAGFADKKVAEPCSTSLMDTNNKYV
jgi:hypothetical protein